MTKEEMQVSIDGCGHKPASSLSGELEMELFLQMSKGNFVLYVDPGIKFENAIVAFGGSKKALIVVESQIESTDWVGKFSSAGCDVGFIGTEYAVTVIMVEDLPDLVRSKIEYEFVVLIGVSILENLEGVVSCLDRWKRLGWVLPVVAKGATKNKILDLMDLPESSICTKEFPEDSDTGCEEIVVDLMMGAGQRELYEMILEDYMASVERANSQGWPESTPAQMLHGLYVKLRHATSGFFAWRKENENHVQEIESNVKLEWMESFLLRLNGHQCVISCEFLYSGHLIRSVCERIGISVEVLEESSSRKTLDSFDKGGLQVVVLVGGVSILGWMVNVPYVIVYEPPSSAFHKKMLERMINKLDMPKRVLSLCVRGSIEEAILEDPDCYSKLVGEEIPLLDMVFGGRDGTIAI